MENCWELIKKKKKRRFRYKSKKKLNNRDFIEKRPEIANLRKRIGDVEGDFIVSGRDGKGVLLVVIDRKLRVVFLEIIYKVTIKNVHKSFLKIKKRFPEMKTLTLDNDILFRKHLELEKILDLKIYFCNPYSSWEKGTVENINKIIRQYIPKGNDLSKYNCKQISELENILNNRFLKCLNYKKPLGVLKEYHKKQKNNN